MAEGMFSKDSRRVPGPAAKDGGLLSTQKTALRDVKNTLQSHRNVGRSASKPFLESFNSVPVKQDLGSRSVIYCDSNNQFWDPCDCSKTDDGLGFPRLPGEYLHSTDFSYVMRGLVGIPSSNYGNDCDYNDVECSYLGEPFVQNLPDIIDMLPVPTEIYLPTIDLDFDPPSLIDVEDE